MKTVSPQVSFPEVEARIAKFWEQDKTFERSLEIRKDAPQYLFYDGPPFATGLPHYGHLLAGTIKDIIPRYQTMKGNLVERRFGWDTHGLPIEMLTESELGLNGRHDILNYGVDKFNEACREGVLKYVDEWRYVVGRIGRWIDMDNDYKTMDLDFMESVWWVFKQLWDQGRIYHGSRVMPYSWRLSTPLSNFEASSNYKDVQDPAVTIRLEKTDSPNTYFLAWTTTPWTLPSNIALCVGPEIEYVTLKPTEDEASYILAKERVETYFPKKDSYEITATNTGEELAAQRYKPLLPYFAEAAGEGAFRIVVDSYVTTQDGTGIVHQSPAHGEDDHRVCKLNNLPMFDPVDAEGNFTEEVPDFAGRNIKEVEKDIIHKLKNDGSLFRSETIDHSYPFCERSDTPLIYKAISAWYVKVEDMRESMSTENSKIHWVPEHVKEGRFGNWLRDARDWNISRNRFWGNPIPIWQCEGCEATECIGSKAELEEKSGAELKDIHKHFVDHVKWECKVCGKTMRRTPEVLDCWFESGSMPYAQLHYPFENKELFDKIFPADFIAEGLDQTRGWFYTLMVLSNALFEKAPFQNVIVNGMILAEDGKKMSKRLKNYPDPVHVLDTHGADALRLYMINSPVVRGESLRFSEAGVKDIVRTVLLPLWNAYSFFTTYATIDSYKPDEILTDSDNIIDQWIISRFQTLLNNIESEMKSYHLFAVVPNLLTFLEELTNWYVRRSRRRFWAENEKDKQQGYNTLYYVLTGFSRALAPFLPFVTDDIYQNLITLSGGKGESVHLTDYPTANEKVINTELEDAMSLIREVVDLGRVLRSRLDIRTRQPLQSITVVTRDENASRFLKSHETHVKEELNVKEVLFRADEEEFVTLSVKPNFPVVGPRIGKQMGKFSAAIKNFPSNAISEIEAGKELEVLGETYEADCFVIKRSPKAGIEIENSGALTVFFDTNISEELKAEGNARELVNRIQRMRKDADFHVSDRIIVAFKTAETLSEPLLQFKNYIMEETLATELELVEILPKGEHKEQHDINEEQIEVAISRVQ